MNKPRSKSEAKRLAIQRAPERTPLSEWWRDAVIAWERGEQPPDGIYGKLAEVATLEQERDAHATTAERIRERFDNAEAEVERLRDELGDLNLTVVKDATTIRDLRAAIRDRVCECVHRDEDSVVTRQCWRCYALTKPEEEE